MDSHTSLPSFPRSTRLRLRVGALAFMIATAPAIALAASSGEPSSSGVPVPTSGLVNAALTARMSAQSTSLRDAVSRHSELIKELVLRVGDVVNCDRLREHLTVGQQKTPRAGQGAKDGRSFSRNSSM